MAHRRKDAAHTRLERFKRDGEFYALSDRSDPFVRQRIAAHIRNGICDPNPDNGQDCHYSAVPTLETRYLPDGSAYQVTIYTSAKHP